MKARILPLIAIACLLAGNALADPLYYYPDEGPSNPAGYGEEFRPGDGYDFGYYPQHVPHPPSTQYGPLGRGSYAQPSYRTPDTTTLQRDDGPVSTYTVEPPPPAYSREGCVRRSSVERRAPRGRKHYSVERTYDYRIVAGYAVVVPPRCGRIVGVLAPAH